MPRPSKSTSTKPGPRILDFGFTKQKSLNRFVADTDGACRLENTDIQIPRLGLITIFEPTYLTRSLHGGTYCYVQMECHWVYWVMRLLFPASCPLVPRLNLPHCYRPAFLSLTIQRLRGGAPSEGLQRADAGTCGPRRWVKEGLRREPPLRCVCPLMYMRQ